MGSSDFLGLYISFHARNHTLPFHLSFESNVHLWETYADYFLLASITLKHLIGATAQVSFLLDTRIFCHILIPHASPISFLLATSARCSLFSLLLFFLAALISSSFCRFQASFSRF